VQVARLYRLDVSAKRRRGGWELNCQGPAAGALPQDLLDCELSDEDEPFQVGGDETRRRCSP
jgi:hypothetical protein